MGITPIETSYRGYLFRSRLEARWAVCWDAAGIKYEYEKEGFKLSNGEFYLPDFWLPGQRAWVEIKGQDPTPEELLRCRLLAELGDMVFMIHGNIGDHKVIGWAQSRTGEIIEHAPTPGEFKALTPASTLARNKIAMLVARSARFEYDYKHPRVRFEYTEED